MPFKRKGSPYYQFDFQVRGVRFCGSTRTTNLREAKIIEQAEKVRARTLINKRVINDASRLSIDEAAARYFEEVGKHHACADETFANLNRLVDCTHLRGKRLCDITDNDVTRVVAWRRGHHRWGRKDQDLISPSTVNRSTTEVLQKIFTRAKRKWNGRLDHEPDWRDHSLPEL